MNSKQRRLAHDDFIYHKRLARSHFITRVKQRISISFDDKKLDELIKCINGDRSSNKKFRVLEKYNASKPNNRQRWLFVDTGNIELGTIWILWNCGMMVPVTCLPSTETPDLVKDNQDWRYNEF